MAELVQPLTIALEVRRSSGQFITATASLPEFFTVEPSIPEDKQYDPLTDDLQVAWISTVPVRMVELYASKDQSPGCSDAIVKTPQASDTYVQFNANELGLDADLCSPMSYARITVEAVDSIIRMQTNVSLASAKTRLNQHFSKRLLGEPYTESE